MDRWPRISIVTPSFNQARYIVATVESVIAQDYPNLDHIVIDGGSTDGTLDRLARYTHVRLVSEADRGHADALNKGFRLATGEIWGFLNSDDTLLPGALHRVAREVDPGRGRQIVMGRCRFVDAEGRSSGVEHPSRFEGHRRVLEIWKGHTIPQPAVFWTPEVWKACGPLDDQLQSARVDYDLFCRFSRRYRFHFVDQVLAAYRLRPESKTGRWARTDRLEDVIAISRSHWGSPLRPLHWRLALSLALFRMNRLGRARRYLRHAHDAWRRGEVFGAVPEPWPVRSSPPRWPSTLGSTLCCARGPQGLEGKWGSSGAAGKPSASGRCLSRPHRALERWVGRATVGGKPTRRACDSVGQHSWVDGPPLHEQRAIAHRPRGRPCGWASPYRKSRRLRGEHPSAQSDGRGRPHGGSGSSSWFVPHRFARNGDYRPLAWRLIELELADGPVRA